MKKYEKKTKKLVRTKLKGEKKEFLGINLAIAPAQLIVTEGDFILKIVSCFKYL